MAAVSPGLRFNVEMFAIHRAVYRPPRSQASMIHSIPSPLALPPPHTLLKSTSHALQVAVSETTSHRGLYDGTIEATYQLRYGPRYTQNGLQLARQRDKRRWHSRSEQCSGCSGRSHRYRTGMKFLSTVVYHTQTWLFCRPSAIINLTAWSWLNKFRLIRPPLSASMNRTQEQRPSTTSTRMSPS